MLAYTALTLVPNAFYYAPVRLTESGMVPAMPPSVSLSVCLCASRPLYLCVPCPSRPPHNLSCLRVCGVACTHAQILLPFAIGNGVTAMALYGILDKSAGGPEQLAALNYDMGSFVSVPVVGKAHESQFKLMKANLN